MTDKVVFRKYRDGEIIALFPQISDSVGGYYCQSYMHVGQHGAADTNIVVRQTTLAKPDEYAELLEELEQIGYSPIAEKRCTYKDFEIRRKQF